MKKGTLLIVAIIAIAVIYGISFNNSTVTMRENAKKEWANVETAYQRRNDLYSTLMKTVQGSADFEKSTLTEVIEARSKATQTTIDPTNITPEQLAQFQKAQSDFSSAISRLLVTVERYPDIKSTESFRDFIAQQEGTENRIGTARVRYNEEVNKYNIKIQKFPGNVLAGILNFDKMALFEAQEGADKVPDVDFNFNK